MDKKNENKRRSIDAKAEREELVANYTSPHANTVFYETLVEHIYRSRLRLEGIFCDDTLEELVCRYREKVRNFHTIFRELILQDKWLGRDMYAERIVLAKDGNTITRYFTPRLPTPGSFWAIDGSPFRYKFGQELKELENYFMDVDIKMRHLLLDGWKICEADSWPRLPYKVQVAYKDGKETRSVEVNIHMYWITSLILALSALMNDEEVVDEYSPDYDALVMDINNILCEMLGKSVEVKSFSFPEIEEWAAQTAWQLEKKAIHCTYDWHNVRSSQYETIE